MKALEIQGYVCNECEEVYDEKIDAGSCCNKIIYVDCFRCTACKALYDFIFDAEQCCDPKTSQTGYMYLLRKLEEQGQQCLFK